MPDYSKAIVAVQELIDRAIAADAVTDANVIATLKAECASQIAAALQADAAVDAVAAFKAKDDQIASLKARIAILETPPEYVTPPSGRAAVDDHGVPRRIEQRRAVRIIRPEAIRRNHHDQGRSDHRRPEHHGYRADRACQLHHAEMQGQGVVVQLCRYR